MRIAQHPATLIVAAVIIAVSMTCEGCGKKSTRRHSVSHDGDRTFTNTVGMTFVRVPVESFVMGNDDDRDASPSRRVDMTDPYYLQTTEVTQQEWDKVMGEKENPSNPKGADLPVNMINWNMAKAFVARLNELEDCENYRLPTEAEWEYAAKYGVANQTTSDLDNIAWYYDNSGDRKPETFKAESPSELNCRPHPVAGKNPNALGLFDMIGNVEEFCEDRYYTGGYNGTPTEGGSIWYTLRGGGFDSNTLNASATARHGVSPEHVWTTHGLRVLYDPHPRAQK